MRANLVDLSDYVWSRTLGRLDGLTDDEYLWEPAANCWTVREDAGGTSHADPDDGSDVAPFATIAWRVWHLISCYGAQRNRAWLGLPVAGAPDSFEDGSPAPATAAEALATLEAAQREWSAVLEATTDASLAEKLGPVAGDFADTDRAAYVLHMLDEFVHHAAEVALLRDLWRATRP